MDPQQPPGSPPPESPPPGAPPPVSAQGEWSSGSPSSESPPPPAWGPPPAMAPAYAGPAPRPGTVTAASIMLIVLGVLVGLLGLLFVLGGSLIGSVGNAPELEEQLGGIPTAFGGFVATIGVIVLVYGIGQVATGIFVLPGKSWARIAGIILAVLGALFGLLGLIPGEGSNIGGVIVSLVVLLAYAFTAWALITSGSWFAAR